MCIPRSVPLVLLFFVVLYNCKPSDKNKIPKEENKETLNPKKALSSSKPSLEMEAGQAVYNKYCLICHQSNGSGVPGLNSPLIGTEYVLGDKNRLLKIILNGSEDGLELNDSEYANVMPSFRALSDEQIAEVATYIRNSFGNNGSLIDAKDVKEVRANILN